MTQKWIKSKSGLLLPATELPPATKATMVSYGDIAKQAAALQALFTKHKRPMSKDLTDLCKAATELHQKWEAKQTAGLSHEVLLQSLSLNRIANAVLRLKGHPRASEFIEKLADGDINMLTHQRTVARDAFWEVEFWHFMLRAGLDADLVDPPDVIWKETAEKTAIACKRIYSEKHIQNVLSNAVHQIEAAGGFGIAAFQLEDVKVPDGKMLANVSQQEASAILQGVNQEFLHDHQRHFERYFTKDRLSAALVATSCFTIIENAFVNTQWTVWTHPQLSDDHKNRVYRLHEAILAASHA